MLAARSGSPSLVTGLLNLSSNPTSLLSAEDNDGNTALHFASAYGHLKCLRILLQAGADPVAPNRFGCTPVMSSRTKDAGQYFVTLVHELEKRKGEEREREKEMTRRREGGVRIVNEDEEFRDPREVLGQVDAGKLTPTGLRAQWGFGGRMRAGSAE